VNKIFVSSDEAVDDVLALFDGEELLAVDTETSGLDMYLNELWSVQIASREVAALFPYHALNEESRIKLRKAFAGKTIIAHYAKFDTKFLFINGFDLDTTTIYCTKESEQVLYAGKYFTFGLKDLLFRRFQIQMSKEPRAIFYSEDRTSPSEFQCRIDEHGHWGAWTEELIDYALTDVEYLHEIYDAQAEDSRQLGTDNVLWLESRLVPAVAEMEARGVWLDDKAVKKFQSKVSLRRDELKQELFTQLEKEFNISWQKELKRRLELWNAWKRGHEEVVLATRTMKREDDKRKKTDEGLKLVEESNKKKPFNNVPKDNKTFNPNSSDHLRMALSQITGLNIATTNKDWLVENSYLHPAIEELVEFRKFEKLCQFCEMTDEVNPKTGRIHASFNQNGTKSGRFSCDSPNLQQIPARTEEGKEFRSLFKAPEGYMMVGADLAGIELVILAYFAGETGLIEAINRGDDVHCYTMSRFLDAPYATLLKAKDAQELTEEEDSELASARKRFESSFNLPDLQKKEGHTPWVKTLRDYIKTLTYGLAYGLSDYGLSVKFHCERDVAKQFINKFFVEVYPSLKKLLSTQENLGLERLYAVNPLGRRRWFTAPYKKNYKKLEEEVMKSLDKQKRLWESVSDEEWNHLMNEAIKEDEKEYKGKLGYIRRQAGNFFPQSLCAEMVKLAMVMVHRNFKAPKDEGLILTVHDELWLLVKLENVERAVKILEEAMEFAVTKFMPDILTRVKAVVSPYWVK
jgi:DNA polymerase I-like protein with 3'-5' exonuclease and polymerase domains